MVMGFYIVNWKNKRENINALQKHKRQQQECHEIKQTVITKARYNMCEIVTHILKNKRKEEKIENLKKDIDLF